MIIVALFACAIICCAYVWLIEQKHPGYFDWDEEEERRNKR